MIEAEVDIEKLCEFVIDKKNQIFEKKKFAEIKLHKLREEFRLRQKKNAKGLCEIIINDLISISMIQSLATEDFILDTRANALDIAKSKVNACEKIVSSVRRKLEKEALEIIEKKNMISVKLKTVQEKEENMESIAKPFAAPEKSILKSEENLKKREELCNNKIKQIEALERQIDEKEQKVEENEKKIQEKEKKTCEITPEKKKSDNSYQLRENFLKQKEAELQSRNRILDDKKKQIEDYKSKIKWRLNNISSLEKKSEKLKSAAENKIVEFHCYVQEEEKKMEQWKEKNKMRELTINELKEKCGELEKALKEREEAIVEREEILNQKEKEFDSIEEFIQIEKNYDIGEYSSMKFTDFAKSFQQRQNSRKKEYDEISKEKKNLSEKISSLLNLSPQ